MDTETGWGRAAGESSGRWRSLIDRAAGRARVNNEEPQEEPPAPPQQPPGQYPADYPAAAPQAYVPPAYPATAPQAYPSGAPQPYPAQPPSGSGQPYPAPQAPRSPSAGVYGTSSAPGIYGAPASQQPAPPRTYGTPAAPAYPAAAPGYAAPAPAFNPPAPSFTPPAPPAAPALDPAQTRSAAMPAYAQPVQAPPAAPLGIVPAPGSTGARAISVLRRNFGGPRVIAFGNPKGGVHKTTSTVLTAAAIGGARGRGVLAWDDNELRGTLGLRAGSARHAKTIRHLVSELAEVEYNNGPALLNRIDDFLRHASDGTYDVLAGEEDPRFSWRLDPPTVRRVLDLLTRTHEVICVDTGNNVESGNWRTIMESADQLVITTVPREDSAFSADWMMDVLVENGREDLVANAVTIVSMTTPRPGPMQEDLVRHFRQRNRAVCVVPYDPVLEQGGWIDHTVLGQATREAWLEAAATIMEPFAQ